MSVITGISCLLITSVVVFAIYDCWIMYQHQLAGGRCSVDLNMELVIAIPVILGVIIGTILTRKIVNGE